MHAQTTSASLLGRLQACPTDGPAWELFVARYGPQVLAWCRHWRLQDADAQDVAQAVLLRLSSKLRTFRYDPARSFRAYVKTLARYAWRDWVEHGRRSLAVGSGDSQVGDALRSVEAGDDLATRMAEEFDRELFEAAALRVQLRVEPQTWNAFQLTAVDGLAAADAAARLAMGVAAVFKAKSRVQAMLRDEIRRLDSNETDGDQASLG
jgi:RNA polymerase sigma-70 factor (ECF subfamily)